VCFEVGGQDLPSSGRSIYIGNSDCLEVIAYLPPHEEPREGGRISERRQPAGTPLDAHRCR
jgi:hypothetical protein